VQQHLLLVLLLELLNVRICVLLEMFVYLRAACLVVEVVVFGGRRVVALGNTEHQLLLNGVIDPRVTAQVVCHQQLIIRHAEVVRTRHGIARHLLRSIASTRRGDRREVSTLGGLRTLMVFFVR
jgi:hypothetical protein